MCGYSNYTICRIVLFILEMTLVSIAAFGQWASFRHFWGEDWVIVSRTKCDPNRKGSWSECEGTEQDGCYCYEEARKESRERNWIALRRSAYDSFGCPGGEIDKTQTVVINNITEQETNIYYFNLQDCVDPNNGTKLAPDQRFWITKTEEEACEDPEIVGESGFVLIGAWVALVGYTFNSILELGIAWTGKTAMIGYLGFHPTGWWKIPMVTSSVLFFFRYFFTFPLLPYTSTIETKVAKCLDGSNAAQWAVPWDKYAADVSFSMWYAASLYWMALVVYSVICVLWYKLGCWVCKAKDKDLWSRIWWFILFVPPMFLICMTMAIGVFLFVWDLILSAGLMPDMTGQKAVSVNLFVTVMSFIIDQVNEGVCAPTAKASKKKCRDIEMMMNPKLKSNKSSSKKPKLKNDKSSKKKSKSKKKKSSKKKKMLTWV